uniref:Uncharacterized protein n=1 Tax=Rhizophora mucronata TaxID=61149 RepID=A0A2P2NK44_RHIMU
MKMTLFYMLPSTGLSHPYIWRQHLSVFGCS